MPYRKQLNFTFDGLTQAANSVERLRNFKLRVAAGRNVQRSNGRGAPPFPKGRWDQLSTPSNLSPKKPSARMKAALDSDLNTAEALGAMFEMVREANAAMDADNWQPATDREPLLDALQHFDEIFGVLEDDDLPKIQAVVEWAKANGREADITPAALDLAKSAALSDEQDRRASRQTLRRPQEPKTSKPPTPSATN